METTSAPVVFSASDTETVTPPGSPRRYTLGVLSYRQRHAFQRELRQRGLRRTEPAVMLGVLREVMQQIAPANLPEVLAWIDEFEADPASEAAKARMVPIEHAARNVAAYADLLEANIAYDEEYAWRSVGRCLRGWSGPGLPDFRRDGDLVPDDLLDMIPAHEFFALASRADQMIWLGKSAAGNSGAPSPAPETQPDTAAA
jgi:hypothetical protein